MSKNINEHKNKKDFFILRGKFNQQRSKLRNDFELYFLKNTECMILQIYELF